MSQPPPYSPYHQAPPPHPQPGFGPPPPFQPYPAPVGHQQSTGSPVGAVLLGFLASVAVSAVYTVAVVTTYEGQSAAVAHTLYLLHAAVNGAAVGVLVGLVGRRSSGARIGGAVVAPLGAFFGYTNAIPFIMFDQGAGGAADVLKDDPFIPAKAWWGGESGTWWISLLGLVAAAAAAWGLAHAVGRTRR
ncbi:hypothetical protein ACFV6F_35495 [Kitasatospora phosalacinea]|uniref:hypothetical protein n=1 Tax=Kitasatospora phosalacinea TaxID=2065 RepID=UPI0036563061